MRLTSKISVALPAFAKNLSPLPSSNKNVSDAGGALNSVPKGRFQAKRRNPTSSIRKNALNAVSAVRIVNSRPLKSYSRFNDTVIDYWSYESDGS